jgi:TFIIF-interacting CTD phosphatase-like protein
MAKIKMHDHIMYIKFRPLLKEFFESILDKYVIFIYTHGTTTYAEAIIDYINSSLNYNYLSKDNLVARETNDHKEIKSIKRIFPSFDDMVICIDDRTDVWEDSKNLINIVPYFFFQDKHNFRIENKYIDQEKDLIFFSIEKLLNFLHSAFYYYYSKRNERYDVKNLLSKKLNSVFKNFNFLLSGLYNKNVDIYGTKQAYVIDLFGGHLLQEYGEEIDIVITNEYKSKNNIR